MCSGHGTCTSGGICLCNEGYRGVHCAILSANAVPVGVRVTAYIFAGIGMAACVLLAIWTFVMRNEQTLRRGMLIFLLLVNLGCLLCISATFPIGAESNPWGLDAAHISRACNAEAWLLCLGTSVLYSAMISKVWRFLTLVESSERGEKVKHAGLRDQLTWMVKFVGLNVVLLTIMTGVGPLEYVSTNQPLTVDADGRGVSYAIYGSCGVNSSTAKGSWQRWVSGLAFLAAVGQQVMLIGYGNALCYRARGIPAARLETRAITTSMGVLLYLGVMAILLNLATRGTQPLAQLCIKWATIITVVYATLGLIFTPKILDVHFPSVEQEAQHRAASIKQLEENEAERAAQAAAMSPSALVRATSSGAAGSGGPSRFSPWQVVRTKLQAVRVMKLKRREAVEAKQVEVDRAGDPNVV